VGASTFNSDTTVTVAVGDDTDSATEGTDYATVADLTVTISAGQSSGSVDFELTPANDSLDEDTETVSISGSSSTKVTFTDTSVDISDNDSPPTVSISDATATEGAAVEFTVSLDAASGKEVKVKWQTVTDTAGSHKATADTDYTAQTLTEITISAGATSTTVTVDTADDVIDEENETFKVQLSEATNAVVSSSAASAVGTITDNDGAPSSITLSVDADTATAGTQTSVAEEGGAKTARITATVDGSTTFNADTTVTVAVGKDGDTAIEGTDYTTVGALTITISAGEASGYVDFTLSPTDDSLDEDDETLSITGTAGSLTVNPASVSIDDDDDPPTVSVTAASATEGTAVEFMVTLDAASGRDVKVKWATADHTAGTHKATADSDYTAQTATEITITAGVTTKTVTVATLGDVIDEPAETFLVQLSDATNANISGTAGSATGTISDDDATPTGITLSVDADTGTDEVQSGVAEEGGAKTARITATVDGDTTFSSATTVTVTVGANTDSATEGTDYATVGALSVTIPAGKASAHVDFSLSPSDDSRAEGNETISITGAAGDLTLTVAGTSVTIEDDDTTPTSITLTVDADTETAGTQTSVAENGGAKTVRVTATVVGSSTFNSDTTVTVQVGDDTDTATEGTDYATVGDLTVTISAGEASGSVDFELTPTNDRLDEDTESLSISGSSSTKVTFTDTSVSITDDDSPPTISVGDATATEGTAVSFTVSLDAASGKDVKVKWQTVTDSSPGAVQATADTDYTAQALTEITISAGATSTTVTVDTAD
ncbi:MAG: hypothetical protein OXH95_05870, partial [bacterium]|nr:hypothetical protein [bacterium]